MTARSWQMLAAFVAVGVMIASFVIFGRGTDAPTTTGSAAQPRPSSVPAPPASEPHAGTQHHADEPSAGDGPAPLQPFETAKVGDWIAIEMSSQLGDSDRPKLTKVLLSVEAADDQMVTLARTEREASLVPPVITRSQRPRKNLTLGELVGSRPGEADLVGLVVSDAAHEVGGRSFACKQLTFAMMTDLGKTRFAEIEMWVSAEVPVDGVVEIRQRFARTTLVVTNRLVGFGNGSTVVWGTRPDGL